MISKLTIVGFAVAVLALSLWQAPAGGGPERPSQKEDAGVAHRIAAGPTSDFYVRYTQYNFMAARSRDSGSRRHTPVHAITETRWSVGEDDELLTMQTRRLDLDSGETSDQVRWFADPGEYISYDRSGVETGRRETRVTPTHRELILSSLGFLTADELEAHFHRTPEGHYERVFDGPLRERVLDPEAPMHARRIEMINVDKEVVVLVRSDFVLETGEAAAEAWEQGLVGHS